MIRLLSVVLSIGLADSMNPSTIAPALYLATAEHGRRDVLQFTLGVFGVNFAGGAIVALGPGQALLALVPHPHPTVRYILELVAGVVMLIGAAVLWRKRTSLARRELPTPSAGGKSSALLGVTIAAVELPTAFPYFAAIAVVLGSSVAAPAKVSLLVLYNVIYVAPLVAIVVVRATMGEKGAELLLPVSDWIQTRWPIVVAQVAGVAGAALTTYGILQLA